MSRDLFAQDVGLQESAASFPAPPESLQARAIAFGLRALSEVETLELYLSRTTPRGSRTLAANLLRRFGDRQHVLGASLPELERIVEPSTALDLKLLHDVARRILEFPILRRPVVSSWSALLDYLRLVMAGEPREIFRVLFLDKKLQLIADEVMGTGTLDHAPVYPREIVRRALEVNAASLILCHQHPSGDSTPSRAGVEMTTRVKDAARSLGIDLIDHVIVAGDRTASLRTLGLLT